MRLALPVYSRFSRLMGGAPEVLLHANDLGTGTVAAWNARPGNTLAGICVGSPSVNASGWAGGGGASFKTLDLNGTSQYVTFNAEAANYNAATPLLWVLAAKFTASALGRNVIFLGNSANANNYRGFTINTTNDFAYASSNRNATTEFDPGTAVAEGVQGIWSMLMVGGNVTIRQLTSSGETTLLNTTHTMSGTLTVDRFTLGALIASTAQGFVPGSFRFVACKRSPNASLYDQSAAMRYVRDQLQCPLP